MPEPAPSARSRAVWYDVLPEEEPMPLFYALIVLVLLALVVGYLDSDPRKPPAGRK
jgi:hypothetical protein